MADANCVNCDWYAGDEIRGTCHRRAPVGVVVNHPYDILTTKWPEVLASNWCGDWEKRAGVDIMTPSGIETAVSNKLAKREIRNGA